MTYATEELKVQGRRPDKAQKTEKQVFMRKSLGSIKEGSYEDEDSAKLNSDPDI